MSVYNTNRPNCFENSIERLFYNISLAGNMRWMLRSKIHRATVTSVHLDYEGSITIDKDLIDKSGLWVGEKVTIANVNNGNRFDTYVIPGISGSGTISINGAAAHLCSVGDKIIIMGFELVEGPIQSKVVLVDAGNMVSKELIYNDNCLF